MSPAFHVSNAARTISTFSCDIAYSEQPGGFEGFGLLGEAIDPLDEAVAKV